MDSNLKESFVFDQPKTFAERKALARVLVHKTGPLSDYPAADIGEYSAVFARGITEVGRIVTKAVVRPS